MSEMGSLILLVIPLMFWHIIFMLRFNNGFLYIIVLVSTKLQLSRLRVAEVLC